MFQIGDHVWINDSCRPDINNFAWQYIDEHREGVIKKLLNYGPSTLIPESEYVYAIEFPDIFVGGHQCLDAFPDNRGQFITAKHLDLIFEDGVRDINTIPRPNYPQDRSE